MIKWVKQIRVIFVSLTRYVKELGGARAGVQLTLTGRRDGIGSCSGGSFQLDLVNMVGKVLVTPSFPSTFFFFRGAIIRLLLGFGDPG